MRTISIHNYIIKPKDGKLLNDTTESGIILHSMMGDGEGRFLNRVGEVIHKPLKTTISASEKDDLLVSHNTFRKWQDYSGDLKHSNMIGEGNYFVRPESVYAYNKDGQWYSTNDWIFLDPQDYEYKGKFRGQDVLRPDKGTVVFPQDPIWNKDIVTVGDFVTFRAGKYVTTIIDGKTLYRIMGKHILLNNGQ